MRLCGQSESDGQDLFYVDILHRNQPYLPAYQYTDSPWLKSYEAQIHFIPSGHLGYFSHYLIYGGDNNVEVITPYEPSIEVIEHKRLFKIEREL